MIFRSLDAWMSYLRTRESVLKKHYTADSLLALSNTGGANIRSLLDAMISALQPLAFLPFQLDLLYECKQLHLSFKRMDSYHQPLSPVHKVTCLNIWYLGSKKLYNLFFMNNICLFCVDLYSYFYFISQDMKRLY